MAEGRMELRRMEGIFNDEAETIEFDESGTRMMSLRQTNGRQKRVG